MTGRKGKGRKSRRGMLGSFKYARSRPPKKKSLPRRILEWIGGALAIAAMGFVVVLLVWRMISPDYGVEHGEATFTPTRIEVFDEPVPATVEGEDDRVATATIEIEGYDVAFQLTAEQLEGVQTGAGIHAKYTFRPFVRGARVIVERDDWYVEGVDEPAPD